MSGLSVPRGPLAHHFRAPRGHPSIMGHVPFCKYFGSQVFWDPSILGALIGYTNLVGSKYYGVSFIVASIILGSDYQRPYCIWYDFKVARIWDPRTFFHSSFFVRLLNIWESKYYGFCSLCTDFYIVK